MIGLGAIPLGALTGGLAAGVFDLRTPFWLAAAGLLLVGLVLSRSLTSSAIRGAELPETAPEHRPDRRASVPSASLRGW